MKKILLTSTLFLLLFSCQENKPADTDIVEQAAKNTESSFPIKRMSKSEAIIDGIYSEKIKDDEKLKDLNNRFLSLQNDSKIMKDLYDDITKSSENYYSDAERRTKNIMDSALQKEVLNLLKNSSEKYDIKINKLNALKIQINLNLMRLTSFYDAFKIKKTLPEIENYQETHPLETDSLENFINKQNQLLNELKNLK
ncbi:hypothetical protein J3D55_002873 [Chryseobacterium ginsenosidimutans]|jgi:hypothetical protein|uniref:hypothetical protein n=1 Tax=Chryseobacterium ginsenosidimutans TaxID=687846 RepID=UPI002169C73E|nr:hypothetical protein [Chryseobacterium ginsenosidimutans]MCS3869957.1 hypothetical protein [Chryseobacterium ginsenosidimutans]